MKRKLRLLHSNKGKAPGASPGTLMKPESAQDPVISVIGFTADDIVEKEVTDVAEIKEMAGKWDILWVNVDGLADTGLIQDLGNMFGLHALALEDVLNTSHRPKSEDFGDHIFTVTRMAYVKNGTLDVEQISLFFGKNFVVSFQERQGDCLDPVRTRIRQGGRRIRFMNADYLAYAIIDAVIDGYFPVMELLSDHLNDVEDIVLEDPDRSVIERTFNLKHDLHMLKHGIWPMREAINTLMNDSTIVNEDTKPFLRDCYDHVIQLVDIIETNRERASGLSDLYLSSLSNKMNEVMKVLTIIATIFIPLGFIAGLYGMNFDTDSPYNMPELHMRYGYPLTLFVMLMIVVGFTMYFRSEGWIGGKHKN